MPVSRYPSPRCSLCAPLSVAPVLPLYPLSVAPRPGASFFAVSPPGIGICRRNERFVPPWALSGATLCPHFAKNPPPVSFPEKCPFSAIRLFSHPCETRGFRGGFLAFWLSNAAFPPGNGGRLQFCDPDAAFRATRPARWFDGVPPGGFAVFDGKMLPKRCFSSALFPIPNYFYEIVAKIVSLVIK